MANIKLIILTYTLYRLREGEKVFVAVVAGEL